MEGRTRPMKLGWHIIRSPGQKELLESALDRDEVEANFFRFEAPWNVIENDKVGIDSLRLRLKEVWSSLAKSFQRQVVGLYTTKKRSVDSF